MIHHPVRLQISRRKGFDLQAHSRATNGLPAVNCARPGKWGNPYSPARLRPYLTARPTPRDNAQRVTSNAIFISVMAAEAAAAEVAVALFRAWCKAFETTEPDYFRDWITQLRGLNLACWCELGDPCHADVLLEIANG